MKINLNTDITIEQLFGLIDQLPVDQKMDLAKKLRAQVSQQRWNAISESTKVEEPYSLDEIVEEVKKARSDSRE